MRRIRYCWECKTYTLRETCPSCKQGTSPRAPPKFSPEDRHAIQRRREREAELRERGLI
jgi:H/ACA ribonucleoprotein complex subunit 3